MAQVTGNTAQNALTNKMNPSSSLYQSMASLAVPKISIGGGQQTSTAPIISNKVDLNAGTPAQPNVVSRSASAGPTFSFGATPPAPQVAPATNASSNVGTGSAPAGSSANPYSLVNGTWQLGGGGGSSSLGSTPPVTPSNPGAYGGFGGGTAMSPEDLAKAGAKTDTSLGTTPTPNPTGTSGTAAPTYTGLVGQLANTASSSSPYFTDAMKQAQSYNDQLTQSRQNEANTIAGINSAPIPLEFQQGRDQVVQNQYTQQQAALGSAFQGASTLASAANTQQGLQQSGLTSAAGLAQPQQVGYNMQYLNPQTGQPIGGGQAGQLPADAQSAVNSYAQQVKNGQMTRADAESRLSAYGVAGTNALNTALGSGFNTNASNASAATTATGQQIQAAIQPATQALDALQSAFSALPSLQSTGIPILNQFTQNAAMLSGVGRTQASAFQGALQEARSRIDAALVGSIGVNAAAAQASALLPDNMVPSEIPGKIAAAKFYLQNQLAGYTQSGQQNGSSNTTQNGSSNPPGWF